MNSKVGIILVNYNGAKFNSECIDSIMKSTYRNFKIIVVDNASTDNSVEILEKYYINDITLIKSELNLGFSEGNNLGIEYALKNNCDYILMLNNDTVIEDNMIGIMLNESLKDGNAVISPKIYYYDNKNIVWSAGAQMLWKRGIPSQFGLNEEDSKEFDEEKYVEIATGCCLLFHKDVVNKIGYLSDEYFLYYEDTDYTTRMVRSGYKIKYIPAAKMYHRVSASTGGEESENYIYYNTRNRLIFNKKFNKENYITYITYFYFTRIFKIVMWIIKGKKNLVSATFRGIRDYRKGVRGKI